MDLSCNETMINDAENEYNIYMEYPSDGKSSATSADSDQSQQQPLQAIKLYSNACEDKTFLNDRCLKNLLTSQKRYKTPSCGYFNTVQKTLTPQMRKIVAEWVIEVSVEIAFFPSLNGDICVAEREEEEVTRKVNCSASSCRGFNSLLIAPTSPSARPERGQIKFHVAFAFFSGLINAHQSPLNDQPHEGQSILRRGSKNSSTPRFVA
jgi:hypothetical protein